MIVSQRESLNFDLISIINFDDMKYIMSRIKLLFQQWLDAKKSIKRQMMCPPYHLFFRVKFYVSDPSKLIEEYTRLECKN